MTTITVDKEEFKEKINKVYAFVPDKAIIPMYEFLRISVTGGIMEITAASSSENASAWCKCESTADIAFCVTADPFKKLISTLRFDILKINVSAPKDGRTEIEVRNGKSKSKFVSDVDPKFFSTIRMDSAKYEFTMHKKMLRTALKVSKSFIPKNDAARGVLDNVCVKEKDGKIVFFGGTNASFSKVEVPPISINDWKDVVIPESSVASMYSVLGDTGEARVITDGERVIKLIVAGDDADRIEVTCLLFGGKFPTAEVLFAKIPESRYIVSVSDLTDSVKRSKIFSGFKEFSLVKLRMNPANTQELLIVSDDPDTGKSYEDAIPITNIDGAILDKGYNADLLLNVLNNCDCGEVMIHFNPAIDVRGGSEIIHVYPRVENPAEDIFRFIINGMK